MNPIFIEKDNFYFVEKKSPEIGKSVSLVQGIVIQKMKKMTNHIWGYLVYHDQIEERERRFVLDSEPKINASHTKINVHTNAGDAISFDLVTKKLFDEKIDQIYRWPSSLLMALKDRTKTTEDVQELLHG